MSFLDRAHHARQSRMVKTQSKIVRACKARKSKVSRTNNKVGLQIANQVKQIGQLKKQVQTLKSQVTKLTKNAVINSNNQSPTNQLNQIYLDIKQLINDMHVSTHGQSYARYI